jgi:hypothetical protein
VAKRKSRALRKALAKSEEFFGAEPRWVKKIELEYPRTLVQIGSCPRVDYVSDKWDGKLRLYFHQFDSEDMPVILAAPEPQPNGDNMILIIGKFKIEAEGIIG